MKVSWVQGLVTTIATLLALGGLSACGVERPTPMTLAQTATSAEPKPSLAGMRNLVAKHALDSVLPGDGKVEVVTQGGTPFEVDLTPMRGDEVEATTSKATSLVDKHLDTLDEKLAASAASTPGLDTLGVLDQALQVTPKGGTVVVQSSGLSTVAPLNLNRAGDWSTSPRKVAQAIDAANLPSAEGRSIVFVGLGYPAGGQPVPGTAARKALAQLWTDVCRRTEAKSCTVLPGPAGTEPSTSSNAVPVVRLDMVRTNCVGSTALSADVLFGSNSAVLSQDADRVLASIARGLKSCPTGRVVDAVGHYAEVPGGGDGTELSRERAVAVLDRLRQLGAPARVIGEAIGCGGSVPCQLVDNTPGGVYSEPLAKRNRVVELDVRAN